MEKALKENLVIVKTKRDIDLTQNPPFLLSLHLEYDEQFKQYLNANERSRLNNRGLVLVRHSNVWGELYIAVHPPKNIHEGGEFILLDELNATTTTFQFSSEREQIQAEKKIVQALKNHYYRHFTTFLEARKKSKKIR